jgi:hypothetical protein
MDCYTRALPLAAVGCHSFGNHTVVLMSLLPLSAKMTVSPGLRQAQLDAMGCSMQSAVVKDPALKPRVPRETSAGQARRPPSRRARPGSPPLPTAEATHR